MKNMKRVSRIARGEKFVYVVILFVMISMPICTVLTKALLSESNIEVEQMKLKLSLIHI